ncbi:MAG: hypothetical protein V4805_15260 [Pseudomonadota bacterium]
MARQQKIHYMGWDIVTFAYPDDQGKWQATSEIERDGVNGFEVLQGIGGPFVAASKERAIAVAYEDAKRKIDDILADPLH